MLDNIGCDYKLMSMVPFNSKNSDSSKMSDIDYLLKFYKETIDSVHPSVLETVFKGDWNSRKKRPKYKCHWSNDLYVDNHPTPSEHLEYLKTIIPTASFSQHTLDFVAESNNQVLTTDFNILTYKQKKALRLGVDYE